MLNIDVVIKYLSKKGESSFEDIWLDVKNDIKSSLTKELDEIAIKTNLHHSLIEDSKVIMVGGNHWNLKENFSYEELEDIKNKVIENELERETLIDLEDSKKKNSKKLEEK